MQINLIEHLVVLLWSLAINLSFGSEPVSYSALLAADDNDAIDIDKVLQFNGASDDETAHMRPTSSIEVIGGSSSSGSLSSLLTDQGGGATGGVHPFTPETSDWHNHFIEKRISIDTRQGTKMPISRRSPPAHLSFTFNDIYRLRGKGLRYALAVPNMTYTTEGDGAVEVRQAQRMCGRSTKQRGSGSSIVMCDIEVLSPPTASIKDGLPTITLKAKSVPKKYNIPLKGSHSITLTVDLIYDQSPAAYGTFISDALRLEEEYKATYVLKKPVGRILQGIKDLKAPWWFRPDTEGDTPIIDQLYKSPARSLKLHGFDVLSQRGVEVDTIKNVEIHSMACVPFTSQSDERMYFTAVTADIGGSTLDLPMELYMVQYNVPEETCRAVVGMMRLFPTYHTDFANTEAAVLNDGNKKIMLELTKFVGSKSFDRQDDKVILIPRIVPFHPLAAPQMRRKSTAV